MKKRLFKKKDIRLNLRKQFYYKNKLNYFMTLSNTFLTTLLYIAFAFVLKMFFDIATGGAISDLVHMLLIVMGLIIIYIIISFMLRYFKNRFITKALYQYKGFVFNKVLEKNINSFNNEATSKYISNLTFDVSSIENGYLLGNINIFNQLLLLILAICSMAYLNWIMTICVICIMSLPIIIIALFGKKLKVLERSASDQNEKFVGIVKDFLSGFSVIKSFKAEKEMSNIFSKQNFALENLKQNRREMSELIGIWSVAASLLVDIVIFALGTYMAIQGIILVGVIVAFIQLLNYVLTPIQQLGPLFANISASRSLIKKMEESLEESEKPKKRESKNDFENSIIIQNVSFAYGDENVLTDVSFEFERGKSYAIVGGSGSGKSTLLSLLLGYHLDYSDKILLDDMEMRSIDTDSLYDLISIIQQNVFIFDDTIANNISMFKNFDEDEINEAILKAGLAPLIENKGIDYKCGENGSNLSGGEKQRISIARCLLRKMPILLMDEGTASLDNNTAYLVETAILDMEGVTKIIVTHKMNALLLERYDEIIVMNHGKIVETGKFNTLIKSKGYFYALYNTMI